MYIYLISNGTNIKIGQSSNPKKRLSSINVGSDSKCEILRAYRVDGSKSRSIELLLHKKYDINRLNGEWFSLSKSEVSSIDEYFKCLSEKSLIVTSSIKSKWIIKGIEGFVFGEDKNLYRLPYVKGKRSYELRQIKKQYGNRYKLNGEWWSERQLYSKIELDPNPIELIKSDMPF